MIIGGIAVVSRGVPRHTDDVDATVWAPGLDLDALHRALEAQDLVFRVEVGATVLLRRIPDLTAEKLLRILNCHVARSATTGYGLSTTAAERSPLSENGARVAVREFSSGFAVDIRADDPFAAQAILLRAQRLGAVK